VHDAFYSYGEVLEVKLMSERRCALVTYSLRKAAEEAAKGLYRRIEIKGTHLKLWWAKSQQSKDNDEASRYTAFAANGDGSRPQPPPLPGSGPAAASRNLYPSMNPNQMGANVRE